MGRVGRTRQRSSPGPPRTATTRTDAAASRGPSTSCPTAKWSRRSSSGNAVIEVAVLSACGMRALAVHGVLGVHDREDDQGGLRPHEGDARPAKLPLDAIGTAA